VTNAVALLGGVAVRQPHRGPVSIHHRVYDAGSPRRGGVMNDRRVRAEQAFQLAAAHLTKESAKLPAGKGPRERPTSAPRWRHAATKQPPLGNYFGGVEQRVSPLQPLATEGGMVADLLP
jgi:hypothetical protein